MYKRPQHHRVETLLRGMDARVLAELHCYFGGGTAVALTVDEFRESVDVDFLCSDQQGMRQLRSIVFESDIEGLFLAPIRKLRETRADRDGIRNFIEIDGVPVKLEIIQEARVALETSDRSICGVPLLALNDLFAEKLLANADRGHDASTSHRDVIDLLALMSRYGKIPAGAWAKATGAYGDAVVRAWERVGKLLCTDDNRWTGSMAKLGIDDQWQRTLRAVLDDVLAGRL